MGPLLVLTTRVLGNQVSFRDRRRGVQNRCRLKVAGRARRAYVTKMFYGHATTITKDGKILVSPDRLETIGIADGSKCWGAMLPSADPASLSHIIVSPIAPSLWALTFRIQLKITDHPSFPQTLQRASAAVAKLGAMVFSSECAPSGHSHATWNAVISVDYSSSKKRAEEMRSRLMAAKDRVIAALASVPSGDNAYENFDLLEATDRFSREAYRYCDLIRNALLELNGREKASGGRFLHSRFLEDEPYRFYKPEGWGDGDEGLSAASRATGAHAVTCTWNEHLAFHWVFSGGADASSSQEWRDARIEFTYDRSKRALVPTEDRPWMEAVTSEGLDLPARGIATIHYRESYIRLVTSRHMVSVNAVDRKPDTRAYRIRVPYKAKSNPDEARGRGLLSRLAEAMGRHRFDIAKMSNGLVSIDREKEIGSIEFVVSEVWGDKPLASARDEKRADNIESLARSLKSITAPEWIESTPAIQRHAPLRLFVSSRARWAQENPLIFKVVKEAAFDAGFEPVTYLGLPDEDPNVDYQNVVLETAKDRIRQCDAMLQINPGEIALKHREPAGGAASPMTWMILELAFAEGLGIPYRILVDSSGDDVNREEWDRLLKPFAGKQISEFNAKAKAVGLGCSKDAEDEVAREIRCSVDDELRSLIASL